MRNGQLFNKEYRGQRSAEAFATFIRQQLDDPVMKYNSLLSLEKLDNLKRHLIGYFKSNDSSEYVNFARVASVLKDDCQFHAGFGGIKEFSVIKPGGI